MPVPGARDRAAEILLREERERIWVRDLLPEARARLEDPRERALLTELAYGTIRRRATLDAVLERLSRRGLDRLDPVVRVALRLGLYQVLFLARVPAHAAVDHAVGWARRRGGAHGGGYANAVLRAASRLVAGAATREEQPRRDVPLEGGAALRLREDAFADPAADLAANLSARWSMPRWLVARWLAAHGPRRTLAWLRTGIERPPLALRVRGDRTALRGRLVAAGISPRETVLPTALLVAPGEEGPALEAVARGEAWVQDTTAQRVAPLLEPRPGQRLLDLCAAPGGKTLHLADLLEEGILVACDVVPERLQLVERIRPHLPRGVVLESRAVAAEGPLPFEPASFDGILVDAPCSNTGVLRRRVEARWRVRPEDLPVLAALQRSLLERALPHLRPGGRLVYATCSLEPEEDQEVAAGFTAARADLEVLETLEVPPGADQDGGFAVAWRRLRGG